MEYSIIVITLLVATAIYWLFGKKSPTNLISTSQVLTILKPTDSNSQDEQIIVAIVNPHSGSQKAPFVFETQVKQRLLDAHFTVHYYQTQHEGHATEIAKALDLKNLKAIVCVSGDGLFCEMLNGLYVHPDSEKALKIPVGIVPAGTSNGLAASLKIENSVSDSVELIIKGKTRPLDALIVKTPVKTMISSLSVSHGGVADYDYLTEKKLRWMGPVIKMAIAPIQVISLHQPYRAKISLLLADPVYPLGQQRPFDCASDCQCGAWNNSEEKLTSESWMTIEEGIINFVASNVPKIAFDVVASKHAHFCDGLLDIRLLRNKLSSRWRLLQMFLHADTGDYESLNFLEYYKCRAIKMEPLDAKNPGHISVDGHVMKFEGAEISVKRGLLRLLYK